MDIKKFFVYKLFAHSRLAFCIFILFLLAYAYFFLKKMDMTIFSYNSMFVSAMAPKQAHAYALKINDQLVPVSHKLWWKKDFLESSLIGFSTFLEKEQKTYLQQYLQLKISDSNTRVFLLNRLTSHRVDAMSFISNYARTAGYRLHPKDKIEIVKYTLKFLESNIERVDSTIVFIKRSR